MFPSQVGSFNYDMNKLIFRDEFIPVKEEAVRTFPQQKTIFSTKKYWMGIN